jgi:hypothetical protein
MEKRHFAAPPNSAVFISRRILDGVECIYYVIHDEEDGAWQFHPKSGPTPEEEAAVVGLKTVVGLGLSSLSYETKTGKPAASLEALLKNAGLDPALKQADVLCPLVAEKGHRVGPDGVPSDYLYTFR